MDKRKGQLGNSPNPVSAHTCGKCKQPVDLSKLCVPDKKEYLESRICPTCWDAMFDEESEE
jgi:hypothetical protein